MVGSVNRFVLGPIVILIRVWQRLLYSVGWVLLLCAGAACSSAPRGEGTTHGRSAQIGGQAGGQVGAEVAQLDDLDHTLARVAISSRAAGPETLSVVSPQLREIAQTEGFDVQVLDPAYPYLRDVGVLLQDGTLVVPSSEQPALLYARRDHLWAYGPEVTPWMSQGNLALVEAENLEYYYHSLASSLGATRVREADVYVEGGNAISVQCQGEPRLLIGRGSLQFTAALMAHKNLVSQLDLQAAERTVREQRTAIGWPVTNTPEHLKTVASRAFEELTDFGFQRQAHGDSPATDAQLAMLLGLSDVDGYGVDIDQFRNRSLYAATDTTGWSPRQLDDYAVTMAAREELAAEAIGQALGFSRDQVYVLDQLLYHIDLLVRPGPSGTILMQDPATDVGLPHLTPSVQQRLGQIRDTLLATGCDVIVADGVRFDHDEYEVGSSRIRTTYGARTNLFNGFGGLRARGGESLGGRRFFVSNEADVVDRSLQTSFARLLEQLGVNMTYFVRHDGVPLAGAGVACMTKISLQALAAPRSVNCN